jgi:Flp pilus assembly protein TadG
MGQALKREDGSGLVEYAVVFVLFMTMIVGIMDFGRALYSYHFVSHASREAARFAAVHGSTCNTDADKGSCTPTGGPAGPSTPDPIIAFVTGITPPGIISGNVTTTPTWPGNGSTTCNAKLNAPTCPVQVQVSYTFNFLFSWVRKTSMTLSSTSEMIISH